MIFNKLVINNFGPYRDEHEFDLRPRHEDGKMKSILLFGGKNGSGKTNLFEAINLCLFGMNSLGAGSTKKEYEEYLIEKIHRDHRDASQTIGSSVILEFIHAHFGSQDTYCLTRSWLRNGGGVRENFEIVKNGESLKGLDADQWNTFVKELIPPAIAQIFFFDGEKIRKLSGDKTFDNLYLMDSMKSLLGLDVTERLDSDLVVYTKKMNNNGGNGEPFIEELNQLHDKKKELEEQLNYLVTERAGKQTRIERKRSEIEKTEEKIMGLGGEFAEKYDTLKSEQMRLAIEIENTESAIRELCHGLFPFSLCLNLCEHLKNRIESETEVMNVKQKRDIINEHMNLLLNQMESKDLLAISFDEKHSKLIIEKMRAISDEIIGLSEENVSIDIINELSPRNIEKLKRWIEESVTSSIDMKAHCQKLNNLRDKLAIVEENLARTPTNELLKPHIEELNILNKDLGVLTQQRKDDDNKMGILTAQINQIESRLQKINQIMSESDGISGRLKLIARTREVLTLFADELKLKKIAELEKTIVLLFNNLCRKKDLIAGVTVDPSKFTISISDETGKKLSKKSLSSGERQIFAIAILWALKKISGRPIPVIIDTPLSRLDSDHRKKLINTFFPNASHQTIILSTDTEINRGYFHDLKEFISHTYHLKYDKKERMTSAELGYF
ncbi:MAG: DNA sulfur modification protein DndD [Deltaproteobacteria bacterium]|nr:DNA sulfur modification protein DndD [Deltaproteobacteria bacterium]